MPSTLDLATITTAQGLIVAAIRNQRKDQTLDTLAVELASAQEEPMPGISPPLLPFGRAGGSDPGG